MSRYRQTSLLPWAVAAALLAAFVGIVVVYSGGEEQGSIAPPLASAKPKPAPVPDPDPSPQTPPPGEAREPPPPPQAGLSPAQAEKRLRAATAEWRAFAVRLCRTQRWKPNRSVAFLEGVTWSDRDLEKQHAHGLASIRTMLGVEATDPVALAEALEEQGSLSAFFDRNWSKVDAAREGGPEQETVLEDRWKPNRIRWGFPLDTPIEKLREFKRVGLTVSLRAWQAFAGQYIRDLEMDDTATESKWRAAVGEGVRAQEAKMHAALRVLLDLPEATLREVVEEFVLRIDGSKEEFPNAVLKKMEAAVKAAEGAG